LLLALASWILDRASIQIQLFTYGWSYGFWANAIPIIALFLLLLSIFNRVVLAGLVTLVLAFALYAANYLKLKFLAVPVSFGDVYLLENLHVTTLRLLVDYVKPGYLAAVLLMAGAAIGFLAWKERAFFKQGSVMRASLAGLALIFMLSLGTGAWWLGYVYAGGKLRVVPYAPAMTILHAGLVSSLVYSDTQRVQALDEPVDRSAVASLLNLPGVPGPSISPVTSRRPDIVIVQSESFFDPSILSGIEYTGNLLPNLHEALAQGLGGTMDPPTFGGGTLRTEFEVLTGIPLAAYPQVEFPYLQISQEKIPSIIRVADRAGYSTIAIHGNSGSFWNRKKAFQEIGFGQFVTKDDFPENAPLDGRYLSDAAMTDEIIRELAQAHAPTLIFAISIEAHGPYLQDPAANPARRDAIQAPQELHDKGLREYRNYVYHIQNADQQFGRLWRFLAARHRPYVLMFYGDHLPNLPHAYKQLAFDNKLSGPRQFVPWVIVGSNLGHRTLHVHSWMMGSELLRAAGIVQPDYYRLLARAQPDLRRSVPHRQATLDGVYSMARLFLKGQLDSFINEQQEAADVATASSR
jgi:phosphoglycerol transferase MdoB-like AlkP superfamily enzyme